MWRANGSGQSLDHEVIEAREAQVRNVQCFWEVSSTREMREAQQTCTLSWTVQSSEQQAADVVQQAPWWHDVPRIVDTNGKMSVWCRTCSGHVRVRLGRALWSSSQPFVEEKNKETCVKRIPKLEEGQVPEGICWRIEGMPVRVTRMELQRLEENCMTAVSMHKEECGVLVEQKGGGMHEEAKLRKVELKKVMVCKRLWLKKSHGEGGIKLRSGPSTSTKGSGRSRNVE